MKNKQTCVFGKTPDGQDSQAQIYVLVGNEEGSQPVSTRVAR